MESGPNQSIYLLQCGLLVTFRFYTNYTVNKVQLFIILICYLSPCLWTNSRVYLQLCGVKEQEGTTTVLCITGQESIISVLCITGQEGIIIYVLPITGQEGILYVLCITGQEGIIIYVLPINYSARRHYLCASC